MFSFSYITAPDHRVVVPPVAGNQCQCVPRAVRVMHAVSAAVYSYCRRGFSAAAAVAAALSSPDKPTSRKRSTKDETPDGRMRQRCGFHVKPTV